MSAQLSSVAAQDIPANAAAIFTDVTVPCPSGNIILRKGTGLIRLVNRFFKQNLSSCWKRNSNYNVVFTANIGLPAEGGTPGPLQIGLAIDGVVDAGSIMQVEAAANPALYNVAKAITVQVPWPCTCSSLSVINLSNQTITMSNAVVTFES